MGSRDFSPANEGLITLIDYINLRRLVSMIFCGLLVSAVDWPGEAVLDTFEYMFTKNTCLSILAMSFPFGIAVRLLSICLMNKADAAKGEN